MRVFLMMALTILIAACAADMLQQREAEAAAFIGHSEDDLVRQHGVPTRVVDAGRRRFLAYEEVRNHYVRPVPAFTRRWSRFGYGLELFPEQMLVLTCETTFEVADGRVAAVRLHGDGCG